MQLFTPIQYLQIDIANNFGLDHLDWDDRLNWFKENENELEQLTHKAEEPALFFAATRAYRMAAEGLPIGYTISLDATSSGLQLLAVLTGDPKAAKLCNVLNTGHRKDAYTGLYERMLEIIGDTSKITRKDTKQAIMTAFYGSTAMPKQVFGEGKLLDVFYKVMKTHAPAAWELNEAFLALWDANAFSHDWVLPDNFHVHIKVMRQVRETVHFLNQPFDVFYNENLPVDQGRSLGANTVHSIDGMIVRELTRRCDYDPVEIKKLRILLNGSVFAKNTSTDQDKMVVTLWNLYKSTGYLSARILQYLNADNLGHVDKGTITDLLDSLPEKPFKVISIHDAFRVLPNYANDLRKQYNLQLYLIGKSNLLSSIISQIVGKPIAIGKMDPEMYIQILDADYALS